MPLASMSKVTGVQTCALPIFDEAEKATVEGPLGELRSALNGNDIQAIKTAHETLMQASQGFSQRLYEKAAAENAAGTSAATGQGSDNSPGAEDDIIDAEIVDDESAK